MESEVEYGMFGVLVSAWCHTFQCKQKEAFQVCFFGFCLVGWFVVECLHGFLRNGIIKKLLDRIALGAELYQFFLQILLSPFPF